METTIIPRFVEQKVSKAGKVYWQVEDVEGERFTIFDKLIYENLSKTIGKNVNIDFTEKDDWKNVQAFLGLATGKSEPVKATAAAPKSVGGAKEATMLTAYAKDLAIAMLAKSNKQEWTSEEMTELVNKSGAMILELYNDIVSSFN